MTSLLHTPWQALRRVTSAMPNHKAVFGTACRDFAIKLQMTDPLSGGEGVTDGEKRRGSTTSTLNISSPAALYSLIRRLRQIFSRMQVKPSRRYCADSRAHDIDMGRSIKDSFRFGGDIFFLQRRRIKRRQPRIAALCDVSASMIQYAGFTVPLMFAISRSSRFSDVFVCAGGLEPVTEFFRHHQNYLLAVKELLRETTQVGGGTRLDKAFYQLMHNSDTVLSSAHCVLIVSDAETVDPEASIRAIKALSTKVRRIVWLNTQRRHRWNKEMTRDLKRYCHMEECVSLQQTVKILRRI